MSYVSILDFFLDPIFQGPFIGSLWMCFVSALIGVVFFVRKSSLIGEVISHAIYPGMALFVLVGFSIMPLFSETFAVLIFLGAVVSGLLALLFIDFLQKHLRCYADTALCFVLSLFLGLGILLTSRLQSLCPVWGQKIQMFLYGEIATMTSIHIVLYSIFSLFTVCLFSLVYHRLQGSLFDKEYLSVLGVSTKFVSAVFQILSLFVIILGSRSVGILLMPGMLIAPAALSSFLAKNLRGMFVYAAISGVVSGCIGNILSVNLPIFLVNHWQMPLLHLPTGPIIVLVSALLAILTFLCAPKKGFFSRLYRKNRFYWKVFKENTLKMLAKEEKPVGIKMIMRQQKCSKLSALFVTQYLHHKHLIIYQNGWILTDEGEKRALGIIRLHRLWELYLCEQLDVQANLVHHSAEDIEHILTPDLEERLDVILDRPAKDPHNQNIPERSV